MARAGVLFLRTATEKGGYAMKKVLCMVISGMLLGFLAAGPVILEAGSVYKNVDDASQEMAEYITKHSPFSGHWYKGTNQGKLTFEFGIKEGDLTGEIRDTTGTSFTFEGPVANLKIENQLLTFNSVTGSFYELRLDKGKGKLHGTALSGRAEVVTHTKSAKK
jgi:hypothetical protein